VWCSGEWCGVVVSGVLLVFDIVIFVVMVVLYDGEWVLVE